MPDYGFRPVVAADLPMLAEWLRQPAVAQWWPGPDRQIALVREDMDNDAMRQVLANGLDLLGVSAPERM